MLDIFNIITVLFFNKKNKMYCLLNDLLVLITNLDNY